jgi:poly(A) polymerase
VTAPDPHKQRDFAADIVRTLRGHGFEAYWAGGCVRDRLLGIQPKDYDVATSALPEQIREVFSHPRTVAVGAQFGVITVVGPRGAGQVEVATFREDLSYSDGRRPDAVRFSTPQADAQRRDFTINGLFYDPLEDRVLDFVGGVDDLGRRVVRAIGEPRARFEEDKLRLLRAVRFTATYDFALDMATREAIEEMTNQLRVVSVERIADEMRRMLVPSARVRAVNLLHEVGLLVQILPELAAAGDPEQSTTAKLSGSQAWDLSLRLLGVLESPTFPLALAALLLPFVDGEGAWQIARRWKLSNDESKTLRWLIEQQSALVGAREMPWSKLQPLLIAPQSGELIALHEALRKAGDGDALATDDDLAACGEKLAWPREQLDPPPLITGDDLIAHGVPRGKQYQKLLAAARAAQLDGQISTREQALDLVDQLRRAAN